MGKSSLLPVNMNDLKLPQNTRDRAYFIFMMIGIPFSVLWEALVILPNYYNEICAMVILHAIATLFIVYNVFGNMLLLRRTDASGKTSFLPSVLRPGWLYCYPCGLNSPPRAYHCTICNECILKRDHHCSFAGCCVGYYNHRYYFFAVVYTLIGSLYGIYYQWDYIMMNIGGFGFWTIPLFIAPHFAFIFGWLSAYGVLLILLQDIALALMFSMVYLFVNQLLAISSGQTLYEKKHKVYDYNLGLLQNWKEVLGERWHLTWISPFLKSHLLGDGIKFILASEYETVKDI